MPRSHTRLHRSDGIWFKVPAVSTIQAATLLVAAIATTLVLLLAQDISRSTSAARSDVSTSAECQQLANTFDGERAACLRRRWSAMREMKPWPDAPQDAQLEECLRSPAGDIVVPFKTNSCPRTSASQQRAQN